MITLDKKQKHYEKADCSDDCDDDGLFGMCYSIAAVPCKWQ